MVENRQRLAEYVHRRRRELGITVEAMVNHGGPSKATVTKIEQAKAGTIALGTLAKLDTALRWSPGSASAVQAGAEPAPLDDHHAVPIRYYADPPFDLLSDLLQVTEQIMGYLEDHPTAPANSLREAVDSLNLTVDRLGLRAITAQFERNKLNGVGDDWLHTVMLRDYLRKHDAATDQDQDEVGWLRWLVGRHDQLSEAQRTRYSQRWNQISSTEQP